MNDNVIETNKNETSFKYLKLSQLTPKTKLLVALLSVLLIMLILIWSVGVNKFLIMPIPPEYKAGNGFKYATSLAIAAQRLSFILLMIGWFLVVSGGFLALAAAIVGPKRDHESNDGLISAIIAERGLLCSAFAIIFVGVGWQCLDRSSAASYTAALATQAISTSSIKDTKDKTKNYDRQAYDACIDAKKLWLQGRMNHDRLESILGELGNKKTPREE